MTRGLGLATVLLPVVGLSSTVLQRNHDRQGLVAAHELCIRGELSASEAQQMSLVQLQLDHAGKAIAAAHQLSTAAHELTPTSMQAIGTAHRTVMTLANAGKTDQPKDFCALRIYSYRHGTEHGTRVSPLPLPTYLPRDNNENICMGTWSDEGDAPAPPLPGSDFLRIIGELKGRECIEPGDVPKKCKGGKNRTDHGVKWCEAKEG
ncbi:unnamed protein product [Vitrella brassicaformis CCMP3155]|uniref:Uncharacterized protein n=1 Tax=Vitrella brassicaformis (strain CCMP3155) TaxID=1169540 RepID=A0A0G4G496_VITBC|nr:unnamed protein product [Vitrella brassicaformis CCMP3155]|eukprot:CEM23235.1 unnamed protein product [Vitrella brassicaformis CCMP3155]